jgi:serine/threonine protein kinase
MLVRRKFLTLMGHFTERLLFFTSIRIIVRPTSVEFLVHMALAAGVASVNSLSEDGLIDRDFHRGIAVGGSSPSGISPPHGSAALWALHDKNQVNQHLSQSEHAAAALRSQAPSAMMRFQQPRLDRYSVTGAQLDLQWRQLRNVEYLTDGGNSWIHTAVFDGKPVVVKTLKPECQDVALAINEIEGELSVHSRLHHPNIVELLGAGTTSKGVRFVVLERLDGGTLSQRLGYDTRIRDRRRRFWRKKHFSYLDVLRIARSIAQAMAYCHEEAIPGSVVLHRDLKPDNIGTRGHVLGSR